MLFHILVDMLGVPIECAKESGLIAGVVPHFVNGGLTILQLVTDTIRLWNMTMKRLKHETFAFGV